MFIGPDTDIWAIDVNGHRYRRFYAHGGHRADVLRRRNDLHHVMERNGRLPERGEARAGQPHGGEQTRHEVAAAHNERHAPINQPGENREQQH